MVSSGPGNNAAPPANILPNPYATRLPNPYPAATVAEAAPVNSAEQRPKTEQWTRPAFHQPHMIDRPKPKGANVNKPTIARPAMSAAASSSSANPSPSSDPAGSSSANSTFSANPNSSADPNLPSAIDTSSSDPAPTTAAETTTTTGQQPGIDFWLSSADQDAAAVADRQRAQKAQRERQKNEKKLRNLYGFWKPEALYKTDRRSNTRAYDASERYIDKLHAFSSFINAQTVSVPSPKDGSEASLEAPEPTRTVSKLSFAPPATYDQDSTPITSAVAKAQLPPAPSSYAAVPPPPLAPASYAAIPPPPPPPLTEAPVIPPPPPPPASVPYNPTISAPPVRYSHTISAPPVRFEVPAKPDESLQKERPAKRRKLTVAEAIMTKMGYNKGEGLGKNSDGITTHLEVKARRTKDTRMMDLSDDYNDHGVSIKSPQVFDIFGGRTTKQKEPDRFGPESKVVVAWGCVDGIDWDEDGERDDGGVRQEMGQAFGEKFGPIERVYVNSGSDDQPVYIKFGSELSALNAVNRFYEGYQFRGRNIRALYYNETKFETAVYDH